MSEYVIDHVVSHGIKQSEELLQTDKRRRWMQALGANRVKESSEDQANKGVNMLNVCDNLDIYILISRFPE